MILLPGVNHASLSNGEVKEGTGDLSAEASLADANDAVGGAAADFLTANFCSDRSGLSHFCLSSLFAALYKSGLHCHL